MTGIQTDLNPERIFPSLIVMDVMAGEQKTWTGIFCSIKCYVLSMVKEASTKGSGYNLLNDYVHGFRFAMFFIVDHEDEKMSSTNRIANNNNY